MSVKVRGQAKMETLTVPSNANLGLTMFGSIASPPTIVPWGKNTVVITGSWSSNGKSESHLYVKTKGQAKMEKLCGQGTEFGSRVVPWGTDMLVITAPTETVDSMKKAGAAYIKVKGKDKMVRLVSPTPTGESQFASSVSVHTSLLGIVGKTASVVYKTDVTKLHPLPLSTGGQPSGIYSFEGKMLVATNTHLTFFERGTLMPFKQAATHVFQHYLTKKGKLNCSLAINDGDVVGYFGQWMVDPYGKESSSPPISKAGDNGQSHQMLFLKKSKKIHLIKGVHGGGVLTKRMICMTTKEANQEAKKKVGSNQRCCVGKGLKANRKCAKDEIDLLRVKAPNKQCDQRVARDVAAMKEALQLW